MYEMEECMCSNGEWGLVRVVCYVYKVEKQCEGEGIAYIRDPTTTPVTDEKQDGPMDAQLAFVDKS